MVISSPCLIDIKNWLVQSKRLLANDSNTGSRLVSTAVPEVNTATSEDLVGPSPASEDSHVEDLEIELENIPQSYEVPKTPHTRQRYKKSFLQALRDPGMGRAMQEVEDLDHLIKSISSEGIYYGLRSSTQSLVQQKKKGIFISQDKYVHEILRKFNYSDVKSASTPTDLEKPLVQDGDAADVDEHLYRSMIGSLMYLTASRPDIMFADSPLELVAYTDSDYAGATLDRKSTTGGCQFLGNRLISWQCKKQTVVATSITEAEYVAAASCCGQVLWIQNQLLDYGYNFIDTVIYIDNTSTICIIENPVQHSKTKHIEIRHHFIRDCNAKKLIQMAKIDTQHNVADLLTKGFDAGRFQYLVSSIGMLNP
ncbi:hypothetical protein Tco_0300147 [Tanacetum coccineum]